MRRRIGEYLVDRGILTSGQVDQILKHSEKSGLRFGEAGMDLGVLSRESLIKAFGRNYHIDFFHVHPDFFPEVTRGLLDKDFVLKYGALPLGLKQVPGLFRSRKLLNLGLLDPSRQDAIEAASEIARPVIDSFTGIKTYLVLAHDFVPVLEKVYRVPTESLAAMPADALDPTLKMFLES